MPEPESSPVRRLDDTAVAACLRRLARAGKPPWLHAEVARRMAQRLAVIRIQPERIIDWWSFLGAGSGLLELAYPHARRTVVEPTAALEQRSRDTHRGPWWRLGASKVEVLGASQSIASGAQLIWSNMMLHAVNDPPALLARWQQMLTADGFVMFSCLGPGTLAELRSLYRSLGWPPPAIDFVDMHDLGDMLVHAGFADPVMDQETLTLTWAGPGQLLDELRGMGANVALHRKPGLLTPRWRQRLEHELAGGLSGKDGRLGLSFEIVYGHAFKAAPRMKAGEATTVSLDDMRALVRSGRAKPVK